MFSCRVSQHVLAQYVAEGQPPAPDYQALRQHLADCATCRAQFDDLCTVEVALSTMPRAVPPVYLKRLLLEQALSEHCLRQTTQFGIIRQLGWDVVAPLVTLMVALMVVVQFMPADVWSAVPQAVIDPSHLSQPVPVDELLRGPVGGSTYLLFWAMWIAMAVILGGLGLAWALCAWSDPHAQRLDDLQHQVWDAAQRLMHRL